MDAIQASHQPRARSNLTRGWPFLPAGVVLLVLFLLPMTVMVAFSLWRTNSDLDIVPDWTLDNYIYFFSEGTYVRTFLKTLIMAAAVTAAGIATALPFAYFLVRYVGRRWQRIVLLAVIVPFWTSYLLRAYAWQAILGEKGALNQFLMGIGLIDEPSRLFVYNDLSVWLVLLYVYFPFAALALYTALEKFDFNRAERGPGPRSTTGPGPPKDPAAADPAGDHHRLHLRLRAHPGRVPDADAGRWGAGRADREPDHQLLPRPPVHDHGGLLLRHRRLRDRGARDLPTLPARGGRGGSWLRGSIRSS